MLILCGLALACGKSEHDPIAEESSGGMSGGSSATSGAPPLSGGVSGVSGSNATGGVAPSSGGQSGASTGGQAGDESAGSGGADVCESFRQAAASALEPMVRSNQGCEKDADCTRNSSLGGCYDGTFVLGGCWVPLAASSAEGVSMTARELCVPFEEAGCFGVHPCPPAPPLVCRSGACAFMID